MSAHVSQLERDPDLLLQTDLELSDERRKRLVDKVLTLIAAERLSPATFDAQLNYRQLSYPEMSEQLRPYIIDTSQKNNVRWAAMEMARVAGAGPLKRELLAVTLDAEQDNHLRVVATSVLSEVADERIQNALRPLALKALPNDADDELRGLALEIAWPEAVSLEEFLETFSLPNDPGRWGMYRTFIGSHDFWQAIQPPDMPRMLNFLRESDHWHWISDANRFYGGLDHFLVRALAHLADGTILDSLSRLIWREIDEHNTDLIGGEELEFRKRLQSDTTARRLLLTHIVEAVIPDGKDTTWLYDGNYTPFLISVTDFDWLLDQIFSASSDQNKGRWLELLWRVFDANDFDKKSRLLKLGEKEPVLKEIVHRAEKPLEMQEKWQKEREERERARIAENPDPQKVIKQRLARVAEDPHWWWVLVRDLTLKPGDTHYSADLERDIHKFPGWQGATQHVKTQIIETAKVFSRLDDVGGEAWIGNKEMNYGTIAGYKALRLLLVQDPNYVESMSPNIWQKWAPIILTYPNIGTFTNEDYAPDKRLLELAYQKAPDVCLEIISQDVDHDLKKHNGAFILSRLDAIWDDRISALLLAKVKKKWRKGRAVEGLLRELVERDYDPACELAKKWLRIQQDASAQLKARAASAAIALLNSSQDASWSLVYPFLKKHSELSQDVAYGVGDGRYTKRGAVQSRLTAEEAAELYLWLDGTFPPEEDNVYLSGVVHQVTARDEVARWRNNVLTELQERGTREAIVALEKILQARPHYDWLYWTIRKARENARRETWIPLTPEQVLKLGTRPDAKLIRGPEQLLDLIVESLGRLDTALQGETPVSTFLWNKLSKTRYRPKDEESLSDLIHWHLKTDLRRKGLGITREPVIRKGEGEARGERLDVLVNLATPAHTILSEQVGVIIEVKGCWNKGLSRALKGQLVQRYLADNPGRCGLYVVGWFMCPQWDDKDARKHETPKYSLAEAQIFFDEQATQASVKGNIARAVVLNTALR